MGMVVRAVGVREVEASRMVFDGLKRGETRESYGGLNFKRLGGGHGSFTSPGKILVHIKGQEIETEVNVASQFRGKFGPRLTAKRIEAIKATMPDWLEVEKEGERERLFLTEECLDNWHFLAEQKIATKRKGKKR